MRRLLVAALAAATLCSGLTACGEPEIDRAAWKRDLAAAGAPSPNLDKLEPLVRDDCDLDDDELQLRAAVASDDGGDQAVEQMRVNMKYVCPDEVERFDAAIGDIRKGSQTARAVCDKPSGDRTERERLMAEALGCD